MIEETPTTLVISFMAEMNDSLKRYMKKVDALVAEANPPKPDCFKDSKVRGQDVTRAFVDPLKTRSNKF